MDKKRKEKIIGIFGIVLVVVSLLSIKIFTYYDIVFGSKIIVVFIMFFIVMFGAKLSMRYFNQLFKGK